MIQHDRLLADNSSPPAPAFSAQPTAAQEQAYTPPSVVEATYSMPAAETPAPEDTTPPAPDYAEQPVAPPPAEVTDATFSDALSPFGSWVDVEGYGRCWQPTVAAVNLDWQPYSDRGHWVYTDCGWYWLSDYSWGWAPFHYGRWFRHARAGWCWAPDDVLGPSWGSWRNSNDYCGWAPLPPAARFRPGFGFTYFGRSVGFSFDFGIATTCYTFVPISHFCDFHPRIYAVPHLQVATIFRQTTVQTTIVTHNNTIINRGVSVNRVAAATHRPVPQVALHDAVNRPAPNGRGEHFEAGGGTLTVFRPHLNSSPRTPAGSPRMPSPAGHPAAVSTHSPATVQDPAPNHQPAPLAPPGVRSLEHRPGVGSARSASLNGQSQPVHATAESYPPHSLIVIGGHHENSRQPASQAPEPSAYQYAQPAQTVVETERHTPIGHAQVHAAPAPTALPIHSPNLAMNRNADPAPAPAPQAGPAAREPWAAPHASVPQPAFERREPQPARETWAPRPEPPVIRHPEPAPSAPAYREPVVAPHHVAEPSYTARAPESHERASSPAPSAPAPSAHASSESHSHSSSDRNQR